MYACGENSIRMSERAQEKGGEKEEDEDENEGAGEEEGERKREEQAQEQEQHEEAEGKGMGGGSRGEIVTLFVRGSTVTISTRSVEDPATSFVSSFDRRMLRGVLIMGPYVCI